MSGVSLGLPNSTWKELFMTFEMSSKTRERLLYLISPLGLIIIWQILLMVGIGDRRFIPAPSDIAQRFVKLAGNGELEWHVAVTLYRVVLGYIIGAVPAVAVQAGWSLLRPSWRCGGDDSRGHGPEQQAA